MLECSACGTRGDALLRCSACKEAWYCNAHCQRIHWPIHRTACSSSKWKVTDATASSTTTNPITNKTSDTFVAHTKQLDAPTNNISYPDSPTTEPASSVTGLNSDAAAIASINTTSIPNNDAIGTDSSVMGNNAVHNAPYGARNPTNVQDSDEHLWDKSFEHVDGVVWEWVNRLDRKVRNVMVQLHGFGDKEASMAAFARKMALPDTACLCIRAPHPVPFSDGCCWYMDQALLDEGLDALMPANVRTWSQAISHSRAMLHRVLDKLANLPNINLYVLGYGQGGTMALDAALSFHTRITAVVMVCSPVFLDPNSFNIPSHWRQRDVSVYILHASQCDDPPIRTSQRQTALLDTWIKQKCIQHLCNRGAGMFANATEMRHFLEFLAPTLRRAQVALENMVRRGELVEIVP